MGLHKARDTKKANARAKLDALLGSMEVRQLLAHKDGVLHSPRVYKYWERLQSSLQSGLQLGELGSLACYSSPHIGIDTAV